MSQSGCRLRAYTPDDEPAVTALWQRAWQEAYPHIDFSERLAWFREHFRNLQLESRIVVAEVPALTSIAGFVVVSPRTGYLDQIVVAPEAQRHGLGRLLIGAAQQICRDELHLHVNQDNNRALAFYQASGFVIAGEDINPRSGAPVYAMTWRREGCATP